MFGFLIAGDAAEGIEIGLKTIVGLVHESGVPPVTIHGCRFGARRQEQANIGQKKQSIIHPLSPNSSPASRTSLRAQRGNPVRKHVRKKSSFLQNRTKKLL
ncbi:MAG: hypothetical protein PHT60_00910 [Acidiphilium sp.]|nr:hypothetical protein [Acidiphilium sp.]MDD4934315.1 hypothetical protein [Acidiphilium sp.]